MTFAPRLVVAAPFLALSTFLLFNSGSALVRAWGYGWGRFTFTLLMTTIMVLCPAVVGVLALKRRWEDFVKLIALFVAFALFTLISKHTSALAKSADDLVGADYPLLGATWGLCVVAAPFVIVITAYQRLVPLIVRRIYKNA